MGHEIDPRAIPVQVMVSSFLKAMIKNQIPTTVVWRDGNQVHIGSNIQEAEDTARSVFNVREGADEVAAIALHAFRVAPAEQPDAEASPNDAPRGLCTIVLCAAHELKEGKPVPWDELPNEIRDVHRLVAKAAIGAAVAHNPPKEESRIIKPT